MGLPAGPLTLRGGADGSVPGSYPGGRRFESCPRNQYHLITMEKKTSLQSRVKDMQPGDRMVVSIDEYSPTTIYNYASDIGFEMGRVYTTSRNRQERTMEILRVS